MPFVYRKQDPIILEEPEGSGQLRTYREGAEIFQAFLSAGIRTGSGRPGAATGQTLREHYRSMSALTPSGL